MQISRLGIMAADFFFFPVNRTNADLTLGDNVCSHYLYLGIMFFRITFGSFFNYYFSSYCGLRVRERRAHDTTVHAAVSVVHPLFLWPFSNTHSRMLLLCVSIMSSCITSVMFCILYTV